MQFEPPTSPHSTKRIDTDRPFPPVGLIVDGTVAGEMDLAFSIESDNGVPVAHTSSETGIGVVVVKRSNPYAVVGSKEFDRTVETLAVHGVRQIVSLSHHLLETPSMPWVNDVDGLTVGVLAFGACARLLAATFDHTESDAFVDGLFLRDSDDDNCAALLHEAKVARTNGFCVCLIVATTLRSDPVSRESEGRLAHILLRIPDAVSPLGSCYCQNVSSVYRLDG